MMPAANTDFSKGPWRKSSRSTAGNDCVEVAVSSGVCAVRDSKNPADGYLAFNSGAWRQFLATLTNHTPGPGLP
jgi:hypothetical protein